MNNFLGLARYRSSLGAYKTRAGKTRETDPLDRIVLRRCQSVAGGTIGERFERMLLFCNTLRETQSVYLFALLFCGVGPRCSVLPRPLPRRLLDPFPNLRHV